MENDFGMNLKYAYDCLNMAKKTLIIQTFITRPEKCLYYYGRIQYVWNTNSKNRINYYIM